jgi:NAD(P)H-quinone oxidoreductase subunit 5
VGALVGVGMTLAAGAVFGVLVPGHAASPAIWVLAGIVALALVPLMHAQALRLGGWWLPALLLSAFSVAVAYFGLHATLSAWVPPHAAATAPALWIGVALAFGALFLLQSIIAVAPHGQLARRLYPWFYGGLFLDEKFNRLAFALWGPPLPAVSTAPPLPAADTTPATAGFRA